MNPRLRVGEAAVSTPNKTKSHKSQVRHESHESTVNVTVALETQNEAVINPIAAGATQEAQTIPTGGDTEDVQRARANITRTATEEDAHDDIEADLPLIHHHHHAARKHRAAPQ